MRYHRKYNKSNTKNKNMSLPILIIPFVFVAVTAVLYASWYLKTTK